jgi:hypothetical protein
MSPLYVLIAGGVSTITSNVTGTIHYAYDNATGQLTHTWTGANDSVYVYDDFGRLKNVSQSKLNNSSVNLTTTYTYDAVGNLEKCRGGWGLLACFDGRQDEMNLSFDRPKIGTRRGKGI